MRIKVSAFVCALRLVALLPAAGVSAEEAEPQLMVVDHPTGDPPDNPEFEALSAQLDAATTLGEAREICR